MPAIITHDQFGRKALAKAAAGVVSNERERNAFLLGNQGPDPLFYCVVNPTTAKYHKLGNLMHHADPSALLFSLAQSLVYLPEAAHPLAKAYIAGFLCHYLLDRAEHPLVYAQQYALCDAGIDGLSDKDGSEVHAIIESDLDEMVLWTCEGKTVASFSPHKEILKADRQTLAIISYLVSMAVHDAYGKEVSPDLFTKSVLGFRRIQHVFHSPRGIKRTALGNIERKFRKHSFVQAMSHRAVELTVSEFDNHQRAAWINPFTKTVSTASFQDLFNQTLEQATEYIPQIVSGNFTIEQARELTQGLNFSGEQVER